MYPDTLSDRPRRMCEDNMKNLYSRNEINELIDEIDRYKWVNWGITGMHANPIHKGHIELLIDAHCKTEALIVALNSDEASVRKHGYSFMPFGHRAAVLRSITYVDYVVENPYDTMEELLSQLPIKLYLKGGDINETNLHAGEKAICQAKGIEIIYNVGGKKSASSRDFLEDYYQYRFTKSLQTKYWT